MANHRLVTMRPCASMHGRNRTRLQGEKLNKQAAQSANSRFYSGIIDQLNYTTRENVLMFLN